MTREEVLHKALEAVNGTRRENYGSVEDSFQCIASYWSTYLNRDVSPKDVANMMILMKVARLTGVPGNTDTYVDIAGYAACGGEITESAKAEEVSNEKCYKCYKCYKEKMLDLYL